MESQLKRYWKVLLGTKNGTIKLLSTENYVGRGKVENV